MVCQESICNHKTQTLVVATLSQQLQCIMLCIFQYSGHILYTPSPELCIADWLSCNNHTENREQEISGMNVTMHAISIAIDIPVCTSIEEIQAATNQEMDIQRLKYT